MPAADATERRLVASIAVHESWARTTDRAARTAPARRALMAKFEHEVDPDGSLAPQERARRAEHLRKAHYQRLALKSARARRRVKEAESEAAAAEAELSALGGANDAA